MLDKNKAEKINKWIADNVDYGYYCEPSSLSRVKNKFNRNSGLNCSDIDRVDKEFEEYEKEFFKKHILRKATPEELEWINKQPRVDLDSPEHEHLKPILRKLVEEGWFD